MQGCLEIGHGANSALNHLNPFNFFVNYVTKNYVCVRSANFKGNHISNYPKWI